MAHEQEPEQKLFALYSGDKVLFVGTYEACKAEWQRKHEEDRRRFHKHNEERQLNWQQRGGRDDERDRY